MRIPPPFVTAIEANVQEPGSASLTHYNKELNCSLNCTLQSKLFTYGVYVGICDQAADIAFTGGAVALLQVDIGDAYQSAALLVDDFLPGLNLGHYLWICKN